MTTLSEAQLNYDHRSPDEPDGWEDYLDAQVDVLMNADDAEFVPFYWNAASEGFAEAGTEALADADDHDCELLQLVLAVIRGEHELAQSLSERFRPVLEATAKRLVEQARENVNGQ